MLLPGRALTRQAAWRHWVALPETEVREAEEEVLADFPLVMVVFEVETDDVAVVGALEESHAGVGDVHAKGVGGVGGVEVVQGEGAHEPDAAVEEPDDQRCNHPAVELLPVAPAGADVDHGQDIVGLAEEFVSCQANAPFCAAGDHHREQDHGDDAPDDVLLGNPFVPGGGLGLVQFALDDGPADRVEGGLDVDDVAGPAVQEHEVVVGDARDERQERFTAGQENR